MKKFFFCLSLLLGGLLGAAAPSGADARRALELALNQVQESVKGAPFGRKTVAVLPFRGDAGGFIAGKLKNVLTGAGFTCVEGKEDPMWDQIIQEIAWDERKDDILDASTLVKFGKLKAAQVLIYGRIAVLDCTEDLVYAELELHATDLATKQHLWGGSFAARYYLGKNIHGVVSLDNNLRQLLKEAFAEAGESIESPEFAARLERIKTVSVIPLTGDIDGYLTGLAVEMLAQTNHHPQKSPLPSLSQLRALAGDGQIAGDAVFYGAVRDLHVTEPEEKAEGKKMVSSFEVCVDVQLFLEDVKTKNILWSKTVTLSKEFKSARQLTAAEKKQLYQDKIDNAQDEIKADMVDNWKSYVKTALWIIGIIAVLFALAFGFKAWVSYRNIR